MGLCSNAQDDEYLDDEPIAERPTLRDLAPDDDTNSSGDSISTGMKGKGATVTVRGAAIKTAVATKGNGKGKSAQMEEDNEFDF
jgi:hypothetical protein